MGSRTEAWAGLAEDIGAALQAFGGRLRDADRPDLKRASDRVSTALDEGLGASQLRVLAAVRESGALGLTSSAVARATGLADSNTPRILKALMQRGLVESSDTKPTVWTSSF